MAFFIQSQPKRNTLLEGLVRGIDRGQEQAMKQQQMQLEATQTRSALQSLFGGGQASPQMQQGQQPDQQQQGPASLMQDPLKFAAYLGTLPIDKDVRSKIFDAYKLKRQEADIPLDVLSKESIQAMGFTPEDLDSGLLMPEEITKVQELRQYLAQNAQSQKDIPNLTAQFMRDKEQQAFDKYVGEPVSAKDQLFGSNELKDANSIVERRLKHKKAEEIAKKKEDNLLAQGAFDEMASILNRGKIGKGSDITSYFGGETAKDYGEFQSLTGALESLLVEKVNKGTLSDTRFQYITKTLLPKPTDTQDEIRGKMKGLSKILELDPAKLQMPKAKKEAKKVEEKQSIKAPKVGSTLDGYRFKGGDPADKNSWEKI